MHTDPTAGPNPSGLCMCGCGATTTVANYTSGKARIRKGQHHRFLHGHSHRGMKRSPETLERMSTSNKGKGTGETNARWNGGKLTRKGRVYLFIGLEHQMADVNGYVGEHRLVAAKTLGRNLTSAEAVHHIDLDIKNNSPENLVVLSRSAHQLLHSLIIKKGFDPLAALREVQA